jgi:hypothetical protein
MSGHYEPGSGAFAPFGAHGADDATIAAQGVKLPQGLLTRSQL